MRESCYVTARDGTPLALDLFRPARDGRRADEPLPVIWAQDCYRRAHYGNGRLETVLDRFPWLETLLAHGYVVAAADARGSGASFGSRLVPFGQTLMWDAYDITEWLARQPWCTGAVGMYGRSYLGIAQYLCASTCPPHLKAIFPEMALFDLYAFVRPGGAYRHDWAHWSRLIRDGDADPRNAPVDGDGGAMIARALEEHRANADPEAVFADLRFRDDDGGDSLGMPYFSSSPSSYLRGINKSEVAIYHLAGWFDLWPRDALTWFDNLTVPQRLVIGPWAHAQSGGIDLASEHLRWYDHWLKGIDTGIMAVDPIKYYTIGAPPGKAWRTAREWPLASAVQNLYYFSAQPSESIASIYDRSLEPQPPASASGHDDYRVDYTTTSGKTSRWAHGYGQPFGYPDRTADDARALTYTSKPLAADLEVTGHPVVHLWLSSSASDGDVFVYLECVEPDGTSNYVTEGNLRASHRALGAAPHRYLGLPYRSGFAEDVHPLPRGEPVELVFDLHPTSRVFKRGSRIRVAVTCADADNVRTEELSPRPTVTVHRTAKHPSGIVLPVVATCGGDDPVGYPFIV